MSRSPHGSEHDLVVDIEGTAADGQKGRFPEHAYALVKVTWAFGPEGCERAPAEPLEHDLREPDRDPRMPLGSDFWLHKPATDVVVLGSAFAPAGRPADRREVRCQVGERVKRIAVHGRRLIEWPVGGRPFIGATEPFTEVPVDIEHAYGGLDPRVPLPPLKTFHDALAVVADHPGQYPRNPFGKGYLVLDERITGLELPNLEDPDDPLTGERLLVGDPAAWHRQPLPWALGWCPASTFPRYVYAGADARYPVSDDELEEVRRGILPAGTRARLAEPPADPQAEEERNLLARRFWLEASLGMSFSSLPAGTPIEVTGMHPLGEAVAFELPAAPAVEISFDGEVEAAPPRLSTVVVRPASRTVSLVYVARRRLPRVVIPGVHRHIDLWARVDGGEPARYEAPPVVRDRFVGAPGA